MSMTLESIVVSEDWQTIGVLSTVLNNLHISMAVDPDPEMAQRRLSRAKFDAVIVDCDVAGGKDLLASLRSSHGGAAIRSLKPLTANLPVRVRFDLPGTDSFVEARGEIAWSDKYGHSGIRFVEIPDRLQRNLEQWLAGRYFAAFGN